MRLIANIVSFPTSLRSKEPSILHEFQQISQVEAVELLHTLRARARSSERTFRLEYLDRDWLPLGTSTRVK